MARPHGPSLSCGQLLLGQAHELLQEVGRGEADEMRADVRVSVGPLQPPGLRSCLQLSMTDTGISSQRVTQPVGGEPKSYHWGNPLWDK